MPKLPWRDAQRLLRKSHELCNGEMSSLCEGTVRAFLTWRAFLQVARGTVQGTNEKNQTQEFLSRASECTPEVFECSKAFAERVCLLLVVSPASLREWYCQEDWPQAQQEQVVTAATKRLKSLDALSKSPIPRSQLTHFCYDVGAEAYALRSALIAHATVHTTGNLPQGILTRFSELCEAAVCAGIAMQAGREYAFVRSAIYE